MIETIKVTTQGMSLEDFLNGITACHGQQVSGSVEMDANLYNLYGHFLESGTGAYGPLHSGYTIYKVRRANGYQTFMYRNGRTTRLRGAAPRMKFKFRGVHFNVRRVKITGMHPHSTRGNGMGPLTLAAQEANAYADYIFNKKGVMFGYGGGTPATDNKWPIRILTREVNNVLRKAYQLLRQYTPVGDYSQNANSRELQNGRTGGALRKSYRINLAKRI